MATESTQEWEAILKNEEVKTFTVCWTDLLGVHRAKLVPRQAMADIAKDGAGFAAFAAWLDGQPSDPDLLAYADKSKFIRLPWSPDRVWVPSYLEMGGKNVEQGPRNVLRKVRAAASKMGFTLKTGVELEFFLLDKNANLGGDFKISDPEDTAEKPCYSMAVLENRYAVISEILQYMISLGWKPYQCDHEDANGQFEMNFEYDECLETADRHQFFKYMTKTIAKKHDFRATFMPKPFSNRTGNGCHVHITLHDKDGKNLFYDPESKDDFKLSKLAMHFIAGILDLAPALLAIFNPTVNSFRRLFAASTSSGSTWAPTSVSWGGNNRTHMIRIPDAPRIELRLPDGATNPYLLQSAIMAAGLHGIKNEMMPKPRSDANMYTDQKACLEHPQLPSTLDEALAQLQRCAPLREHMGDEVIDAFVKLSRAQLTAYNKAESGTVSKWELQNTVDC